MTHRDAGILYVVATPIGNLEDVSPRARRALAEADFIAAEDTRKTRKLLSHLGVRTPTMLSCFAGNEARRSGEIAERLARGERGALVTDAGTPAIADPGARVVRAALDAGARVIPVPGPSALTAALSASGFSADGFRFHGFLPASGRARAAAIRALAEAPETAVLFESPRRIGPLLLAMAGVAPGRDCAVFREVTKLHEEAVRGTLAEVADRVGSGAGRGEYVVVLGPEDAPPRVAGEAEIRRALSARLGEGATLAGAAREVARALGVPRAEAYRLGLILRKGRGGDDDG
ncbi:MAG: 16S rRNA (cytidine(1402)-2'-O)-methyltransferase [Deltaproteobacteria bacterium]|nr:16S rRNA (cytidine(1402)-2'-O)-methyltransferase [Deltaproteobacteria bacterium]